MQERIKSHALGTAGHTCSGVGAGYDLPSVHGGTYIVSLFEDQTLELAST
jgi:hypothetical protein